MLSPRVFILISLVYATELVMAFLTPADIKTFSQESKILIASVGIIFSLLLLLFHEIGDKTAAHRKLWVYLGMLFLIIFAGVVIVGQDSPELCVALIVVFMKILLVLCWIAACALVHHPRRSSYLHRESISQHSCNRDLAFLEGLTVFTVMNLLLYTCPYLVRMLLVKVYESAHITRLISIDHIALFCIVLGGCSIIVVLGLYPNRVLSALSSGDGGSYDPAHQGDMTSQIERHTDLEQACERIKENFQLTTREYEVCILLARGYTLQKISDELAISPNTTHSHTKHIYKKLGIKSKQELIDLVESYREQDVAQQQTSL